MYIPEPVRALCWHLAIAAATVGGLAAILLFGVAAVLTLGPVVGILATITIAIIAVGVATWWISGKERPQA